MLCAVLLLPPLRMLPPCQAGGPDAARIITELGITNSKLRDKLTLQDKQREVLTFALHELGKLDSLLMTSTAGVPASDPFELQQSVIDKLMGIIKRQQREKYGVRRQGQPAFGKKVFERLTR